MRITRVLPLTALAMLAACSQREGTAPADSLGSTRVAVVNGKPLAESVVRTYVLMTERQNLDDLSPEDRERVINDVVGLQLLAQEAEKQGLTDSRALAAQIELVFPIQALVWRDLAFINENGKRSAYGANRGDDPLTDYIRRRGHISPEEVALRTEIEGLAELRLVAQEEPGATEDVLHLQLEDRFVAVDSPVNLAALERDHLVEVVVVLDPGGPGECRHR